MLSQTLKILGETEQRHRGSLVVSEARELLVTQSIPGAFNPNGSLSSDTRRLWGKGDRLPDVIPDELPCQDVVHVCDQEVLWGGCVMSHYGHFLTESVSRLWPLLPGGQLEGLPVVCTMPAKFPFVREWSEAFGVRTVGLPEQGVVRFNRMFVPEPAWRLNAWITPEIRDIHLHARRGLDVPASSRMGVLWLSRSGLNREQLAYDETLLEWILGNHVTIIEPETMTLVEQVSAIEASDAVAGLIGSAFHTILMAAELPDCLLLCPGEVQAAFVAQDSLLRTNATFVHSLAIAEILRRRRRESLGGYRLLIPEALRALSATVLPELRQDPRAASLACPERLLSLANRDRRESDIETAVARVLLDPYSFDVRMKLGAIFEARELIRCALEQFLLVADLSDNNYVPALLGVARLLTLIGQPDEASVRAKQVLAIDPESQEAAKYLIDA
jgi:hypothetical protein